MFKKMIALVLCCIMVLPLCSPVFAVPADNDQGQYDSRSMEEILSDYHTKSRQIENQSNAGAYSRSAQTSDTVRQDAVSELKAAGYEAYDVNPDTYAGVEAELNTDLSDIGLDPESSYIVVISGENSNEDPNRTNGSSRVITLPPHEWEGSGSSFTYTYNGVTYTMRYVTVTAGDNPSLGESQTVILPTDLGISSVLSLLDSTVSVYSLLGDYLALGTLMSVVRSLMPNVEPHRKDSIIYTGGTNWTVTYTQIFDDLSEAWTTCSSIEYVTMHSTITYSHYVSSSDSYTSATTSGTYGRFYSEHYNDSEWRKSIAVQAFNYGVRHSDTIESVTYKMEYPKDSGQQIDLLTCERWMEPYGYNPE